MAQDYFELEAIEKKTVEDFSALPICLKTGCKFSLREGDISSTFPLFPISSEESNPYHWKQRANTEMSVHKQPLLNNPYLPLVSPIYLSAHNSPPAKVQPPFPLSSHFL